MSTKSAASMATSVPAPTAIPTSAAASAGASFTPSPTMATHVGCPPSEAGRCSSRMASALPAGGTSACTCLMPTSSPTARAVRQLSPLTMWHSTPILPSAATTPPASGLMASETAKVATSSPPTASDTHVLARPSISSRNASASGGSWAPHSAISARLPTATDSAPTAQRMPLPGTASKPAASGPARPRTHDASVSAPPDARLGRLALRPEAAGALPAGGDASPVTVPDSRPSLAYARRARASGCSLHTSAAATSLSASGRPPLRFDHSLCMVTLGRPSVRVPVLSNTTLRTLPARSSASPPLMRMPCDAPTPVPTITAVGVARPRAHGHAVTSTAMAKSSENMKKLAPSGSQSLG
mmetsp:Transcript_12737/g.44242  ORF Transcript_12737/g.44242 Transcript_12737/m.44242 type:complete len:356 (+) Transcript_12737:314-1381(+)